MKIMESPIVRAITAKKIHFPFPASTEANGEFIFLSSFYRSLSLCLIRWEEINMDGNHLPKTLLLRRTQIHERTLLEIRNGHGRASWKGPRNGSQEIEVLIIALSV
jgi:hypothetical protein